LQELRFEADPVSDDFFAQNKSSLRDILNQIELNKDLKGFPPELTPELPVWANRKLMEEGIRFFERNSKNILLLLGYYSLPYCYAAADGAKVLHSTGRIVDQTRKRLAETAQFVLDVCEEGSFAPQGRAKASVLKVRLIHSAVRHGLLSRGWPTQTLGLPVNQEDMAGTNLSFSFIILRGLRKSLVSVSPKEAMAYLHLWNVVAYFLGLRPELIAQNLSQAALLDRLIAQRNFKASTEGQELMQALLTCLEDTSPFPKGFARDYTYFLLGKDLSQMLGFSETGTARTLLKLTQVANSLGIEPGNQEFTDKVKSGVRELAGRMYPLPF
jgi:hypothetical protein